MGTEVKVLMVGDEFPPDIGGVSTYTLSLCRAMSKMGVDVTLALPGRLRGTGFVPDGVDVRFLDGFTIPIVKRMFSARIAKGLRDLIRYGGFDVVHGQDIHSSMALFSIWYARRRKIPSAITCHTVEGSIRRWRPLYRLMMRTVRKATMVIGVSERAAETCARLGVPRWKVRVVPNGVDVNLFRPRNEEERRRIRTRYGLGGKIVFSAIRLNRRKGPFVLIEAFADVLKSVPDAMLVIAGTGQELPNLRRRVEELGVGSRVIFLGPRTNDEVAELMASADVFVLPSFFEAFPIALLEAMASGTPVVATRTEGALALVREGVNGLLVTQGEPRELAGAIVKVLTDEDLASRLRAEGAKTVERYTWERTARRVLEIYEEAALIGGQGRSVC